MLERTNPNAQPDNNNTKKNARCWRCSLFCCCRLCRHHAFVVMSVCVVLWMYANICKAWHAGAAMRFSLTAITGSFSIRASFQQVGRA